MDKQLFDDLVQSLKQAKAISKGKVKASRRFKVEEAKGQVQLRMSLRGKARHSR